MCNLHIKPRPWTAQIWVQDCLLTDNLNGIKYVSLGETKGINEKELTQKLCAVWRGMNVEEDGHGAQLRNGSQRFSR